MATDRKRSQPARRFGDFEYRTRKSWSRERRVVGKAEHLAKGPNPRFVVTSLPRRKASAKRLYETLYCARGDMENRINGMVHPAPCARPRRARIALPIRRFRRRSEP